MSAAVKSYAAKTGSYWADLYSGSRHKQGGCSARWIYMLQHVGRGQFYLVWTYPNQSFCSYICSQACEMSHVRAREASVFSQGLQFDSWRKQHTPISEHLYYWSALMGNIHPRMLYVIHLTYVQYMTAGTKYCNLLHVSTFIQCSSSTSQNVLMLEEREKKKGLFMLLRTDIVTQHNPSFIKICYWLFVLVLLCLFQSEVAALLFSHRLHEGHILRLIFEI